MKLINELFSVMSCQLGVMAEYGDDEKALLFELKTCGNDIIEEYKSIFLD